MNADFSWQVMAAFTGPPSPATSSCSAGAAAAHAALLAHCAAATAEKPGVRLCQALGCEVNLIEEGRAYNIKRNCCTHHIRADVVQRKGQPGLFRFCFQCGKLEPLEEFDGSRRSCRTRLQKRKVVPKRRSTWNCSSFAAAQQQQAASPEASDSDAVANAYAGLLPELFNIAEHQQPPQAAPQQQLPADCWAGSAAAAAASFAASCTTNAALGDSAGGLLHPPASLPLAHQTSCNYEPVTSMQLPSHSDTGGYPQAGGSSSYVQRRPRAPPARAASASFLVPFDRQRSSALERNASSGSGDGLWGAAGRGPAAVADSLAAALAAAAPGAASLLEEACGNDVYSSMHFDDLERILEHEMAAAAAAKPGLSAGGCASPCSSSEHLGMAPCPAPAPTSSWATGGSTGPQHSQSQPLVVSQLQHQVSAGVSSSSLPPAFDLSPVVPCATTTAFDGAAVFAQQMQAQLMQQQAVWAAAMPAVSAAACAAPPAATAVMPAAAWSMQAQQLQLQMQQLQMQMQQMPVGSGQQLMGDGMCAPQPGMTTPMAVPNAAALPGTSGCAASDGQQVRRLQLQYQEVKALLDQAQRLISGCMVSVQNSPPATQ